MADDFLCAWWACLRAAVRLESRYESRDGGTATGRFDVSTIAEDEATLRMEETGVMRLSDGTETRAGNRLRWTRTADGIALAHLRAASPTPLLVFGDSGGAHSPHLCGADVYTARCVLLPDGFLLQWEIRGPRKRDRLEQRYVSVPASTSPNGLG
jgi:hypothetical protein